MSRVIDLEKPLSPEDRQYLMDRDRYREIAQNDQQFGDGESEVARPVDQYGRPLAEGQTGDVGFNRELTGHVAGARDLTPPPVAPSIAGAGNAGLGEAAEPDEAPDVEDDEEDRGQLAAGGGDPSQAGQAFSAGSDDDEDDDDDETSDQYSGMTNAQLRKELKARGLSATGKGAEMRSRLRDDDTSESSDE